MNDGLPLYIIFLSSLKRYVEESSMPESMKFQIMRDIDRIANRLLVYEEGILNG